MHILKGNCVKGYYKSSKKIEQNYVYMEPKSQTKNTKHKRNTKDKTVNEKKWTPIYKTHKKWDLAN